jgi:hypothetical protein
VNGVAHRPGFHVDPSGNDFTPLQGLHHISTYLLRLNTSLFAGPIPALVIICAALLLTRRATRWDYLLLGIIAATIVGYGSYWAEGFMVAAPRFLYTALPAFVLFAARFPEAVAGRLRRPLLLRAVPLVLPLSVLVAWTLPSSAASYVGVWKTAGSVRVQHLPWTTDIGRAIGKEGIEDALVFVHDSWHGRLAARLRALGAPGLIAESMVTHLDACALQRALDAEDALDPPRPPRTRLNRVVARSFTVETPEKVPGFSYSAAIVLVRGLIPQDCLPQVLADRDGGVALDQFLPFEGWDRDGRLGGRVVFVRDFGIRNNLLLDRFGDRTWYRYRPRKTADDASPLFIPYRATRAVTP